MKFGKFIQMGSIRQAPMAAECSIIAVWLCSLQ